MILVDTNVLLDLVTDDPVWGEWSQRQIRAAVATDELAMLERVRVTFVPTPRPASFLAGKAFQRYRAAGGIRTGVLPDFFLGAHAQVTDSLLLTRDRSRYRTYFPTIELISPND